MNKAVIYFGATGNEAADQMVMQVLEEYCAVNGYEVVAVISENARPEGMTFPMKFAFVGMAEVEDVDVVVTLMSDMVGDCEETIMDNSEVIAIVQNEQYKGIMIQNKCETVGFGDNKKVRKRNKEDWSVVEGAIPRIVSDEMFDEVNKMLRVEARGIEKSTKKRKKNLFICPYCGRKLMNSSAVCTPKLLCPKRRMVRTGECQQIFMLKSEAQDKVLEITKEICRTLIQEEELKRASKDKRKVTSDEYLISELKAEYDRISNSTVSCYQSYREGKYTKEEYVQLRKKNQELLADLENQISDLQEKVANQEPDAEEKIEQLTQYSMLEQYDGDVLSNIIDKVFIYNDKDIEIVFKGENFIRNAV